MQSRKTCGDHRATHFATLSPRRFAYTTDAAGSKASKQIHIKWSHLKDDDATTDAAVAAKRSASFEEVTLVLSEGEWLFMTIIVPATNDKFHPRPVRNKPA
mmetsp:Transcript_8434/g.21213  ORF Transcript_8434/g.21213 Transcript_8434/m.21213 type:complete len:101 (-) Transcript_8434:1166-1468(-)